MPISLVTKMKVAACRVVVKLFCQLSEEGKFNVRPVVKEKVKCPECHAVDDYPAAFTLWH